MAHTHTRENIFWYDTAESTNSELKSRRGELPNLSVIAARAQTSGRGQGDHKWCSEPGMNLTFSVLLKFRDGQLRARDEQIINTVLTPVMVDFLASQGIEAWVKAPNDIWVNDKKIAGILIENILSGPHVSDCIAGIGFNLNQTAWPEDLPNPVSLKQLTGRDYSPEDVLETLTTMLADKFEEVFG